MALADMMAELRGAVPKLPFAFTKTLVNRAWTEIRESQLWSFNLFEYSFASPPLLNAGTVTVVQGSSQITFDTAVAVPAILAASAPFSFITQRQFRTLQTGGIYNILALDVNFAANGIAYLDRPFNDPSGTAIPYLIYQLYYTPPYADFLGFISVRNPAMYLNLDLTKTREWIDARDPQRSWYQFPTHVIPFGRDLRTGSLAESDGNVYNVQSATYGFPMFELWGQPTTTYTYQAYGIRRGTNLVNPTDTLPVGVDEALVLAKAYQYAYKWAEANKDMSPRSAGPDFKFLIGAQEAEYKKLLILFRKQDREIVNAYLSLRSPNAVASVYGYYNTLAGTAGPYTQL